MTAKEWEEFSKIASAEEFAKATSKFYYDISNRFNCENCPYGLEPYGSRNDRPCGQQNCWVSVHCGHLDW